jgi:hypothetical protein
MERGCTGLAALDVAPTWAEASVERATAIMSVNVNAITTGAGCLLRHYDEKHGEQLM